PCLCYHALSAKLVMGLICPSHSSGTRAPLSDDRAASASSSGTPTAAAAHASSGLAGWSQVRMARSHLRRTCTQYSGCGSSYHSDRHGEFGSPTRPGGNSPNPKQLNGTASTPAAIPAADGCSTSSHTTVTYSPWDSGKSPA